MFLRPTRVLKRQRAGIGESVGVYWRVLPAAQTAAVAAVHSPAPATCMITRTSGTSVKYCTTPMSAWARIDLVVAADEDQTNVVISEMEQVFVLASRVDMAAAYVQLTGGAK